MAASTCPRCRRFAPWREDQFFTPIRERLHPPVALHELFINSVIHRNYDGSTTPASINHFSDRIEIQNPGSLYGDLTKDQFPDGTAYRNPVLAEAAKTLGFAN